MKEFVRMMRQYASPYKGYLGGAVILNMLSAVFNVFSFAVIIPMLNILFNIDKTHYDFIAWGTEGMKTKDILINNAYWTVQNYTLAHGAIAALLVLSAAMAVMTVWSGAKYLWDHRETLASGGM